MKNKYGMIVLVTILTQAALWAQVPQIITYQGRVSVNGTNFTGTGQFKFALVNAAGSVTYWSNDGTSSGGSAPTAFVSLGVTNGLFAVGLGDTSLANMTKRCRIPRLRTRTCACASGSTTGSWDFSSLAPTSVSRPRAMPCTRGTSRRPAT